MLNISDVNINISKDDISYLVKASCESLDKEVVVRFESIENMSDSVDKAKKITRSRL